MMELHAAQQAHGSIKCCSAADSSWWRLMPSCCLVLNPVGPTCKPAPHTRANPPHTHCM